MPQISVAHWCIPCGPIPTAELCHPSNLSDLRPAQHTISSEQYKDGASTNKGLTDGVLGKGVMGVEPINPHPSQNLQLSTYNSAPLKSVDILALYKFVYYGAVLPRRRPHHVLILSICLSLPCLHLEGKQKGLRIPNLVGRVPGTPAPRGPISRSRGQRSRSRRLIAFLVKLC